MNYGQKIMLKALTKGVVADVEREEFDDWKSVRSSDDVIDALIEIGKSGPEMSITRHWRERCEELEVVAAAMYLGHSDGKRRMDMYRSAYLLTSNDDKVFKQANKPDDQPVSTQNALRGRELVLREIKR